VNFNFQPWLSYRYLVFFFSLVVLTVEINPASSRMCQTCDITGNNNQSESQLPVFGAAAKPFFGQIINAKP